MVTDGDMSAAAQILSVYQQGLLEESRRTESEERRKEILDSFGEEQITDKFEEFLCEVIDVRLRLENHLTKNAFKSVFGKKEGRPIPLDTNAPELFEPLSG